MPSDATNYADADGDGDADGADLLAWQRTLGEQAPGGSATALVDGAAVLEPASATLALIGLAMFGRARALQRLRTILPPGQ